MRACRARGCQLRGSPSNLRERFVAHLGCRVGPGIASEQTVYIFIDARAAQDSSGNPFVGLAGRDVNFAVAEQVIVPCGTVTFTAGEASTTTTIVDSFAEPVQLAGGNASFRIALWSGADVLCGKNTVILKGLQIGHNDCPNAGLTSWVHT